MVGCHAQPANTATAGGPKPATISPSARGPLTAADERACRDVGGAAHAPALVVRAEQLQGQAQPDVAEAGGAGDWGRQWGARGRTEQGTEVPASPTLWHTTQLSPNHPQPTPIRAPDDPVAPAAELGAAVAALPLPNVQGLRGAVAGGQRRQARRGVGAQPLAHGPPTGCFPAPTASCGMPGASQPQHTASSTQPSPPAHHEHAAEPVVGGSLAPHLQPAPAAGHHAAPLLNHLRRRRAAHHAVPAGRKGRRGREGWAGH